MSYDFKPEKEVNEVRQEVDREAVVAHLSERPLRHRLARQQEPERICWNRTQQSIATAIAMIDRKKNILITRSF